MKTFTILKESVQTVVPTKTEIQNILSQLSVEADIDLTDKKVEIVGIEEAEIALQEHVLQVQNDTRRQTILILEEALKNGQSWNMIVEKLLNQ